MFDIPRVGGAYERERISNLTPHEFMNNTK